MTFNLTQFAYGAARDLNCLRAGQTLSPDILADIKDRANLMLDGWLLDELLVMTYPAVQLTLTAGIQFYLIGAGATPQTINGVSYGAFNVPRPIDIQDANVVLNTTTPPLRRPLEIINSSQWADIRVRQIPFALPLRLFYDRDFNLGTVGSGFASLNLWPGPISNYGLELFTDDQTVLRQFPDLTTAFAYPPGYAQLIRTNLAVEIAPLMAMYSKLARMDKPMMPSEMLLAEVKRQAAEAMEKVKSYNAPSPMLTGDPAYQGDKRRTGWSYLTGTSGRGR